MENLEFYDNSLHHINLESDDIPTTSIEDEVDLYDYIEDLVDGIAGAKNTREYKFRSESTEVHDAVKKIINGKDFSNSTQIIAARLLIEEKSAQEKIEHMKKKIQKGSLLQSYVGLGDKDYIFITKIDHNAFLDEVDLKKRVGLPFEKKVLKSCLIEIQDSEIQKVLVYDTKAKISVYWWSNFLELQELTSNEQNTRNAFDAIDRHLNRAVKKKCPADHLFLRNALIGYFRTHAEFDFDGMIEYIIGVFRPDDSEFDIEKLKANLNKLPEKKNFDRKFSIAAGEITARKTKQVIQLHENIDLNIKTAIEDLEEIIKPVIYDDGKKYLTIQSDQGYDQFKRGPSLDELN